MNAILTLFWWGLLICVAIFVFKFVLYAVFIIIGLILAAIGAMWEKLK